MDIENKKKFDSKNYYIKNKDKILAYNRLYFKQYYINKKKYQPLNNTNSFNNKIKVKVEPFFCIIKRNVKVIF